MVDLDKIFMWLSLSDMPVKKLYDFALSFDNLQELWELKSYTNHAMKYLSGQEFQELISLRDGGSLDKLLNSSSLSLIAECILCSLVPLQIFSGNLALLRIFIILVISYENIFFAILIC